MGLWEVKNGMKTLNKEQFLSHMEKHWLDWAAEKLSQKEKQAWVGITEIVYKGNVKAMADLPEPDTWTEVTTYKVLFPKEFFYSRYAAVAQIKFPQADLAKWEPNVSGPTATHGFQMNRFIKQKRLGECFRQATELSKRAWAPEPTQSVYPLAKRPRNLPAKEAPDVLKVFANIEHQLTSVRVAAEANTKIHQQTVNELRQSHEQELKKVQKYADDTIKSVRETHRKEMEDAQKAHEGELTKVRDTYQAVISTLNNAYLDGVAALEKAHKKAHNVCLDGAE